MEPNYLEKEYRIHVYETEPDGRVNLASLFNYMQDIASDHAVRLGFGREDLMKNNNIWVLSRMYAVITGWPHWGDKILVKTWPCGTDKLFAIRKYEIRFTDGRSVCKASSSWLIVDRSTKKIQRPGDNLTRYKMLVPDETPLRNALKLDESAREGEISPEFHVRISNLDVNLHTNNVHYLKWVSDTYDLNFVMDHLPCSAEINYLAESMFNDEIFIRTSGDKNNDTFYNHSVFRKGDKRELCRIRLEWKNHTLNKS